MFNLTLGISLPSSSSSTLIHWHPVVQWRHQGTCCRIHDNRDVTVTCPASPWCTHKSLVRWLPPYDTHWGTTHIDTGRPWLRQVVSCHATIKFSWVSELSCFHSVCLRPQFYHCNSKSNIGILKKTNVQWVSEQCFTSPPTQYRLYGRRFFQVKRPNQQYQSTEGRSTKDKETTKTTEYRYT